MDSEVFWIIGFLFLGLGLIILPLILRDSHEKNLKNWIRQENLKILSDEIVDRSQTSFSWFDTNQADMFHRVRVLTADGREKTGFLCVAGPLSPLFSKKVRAKWEGEN